MDSQMATVKSVSGNKAIVELGAEDKTANIPKGMVVSQGQKALVIKVSGKYLIINIY